MPKGMSGRNETQTLETEIVTSSKIGAPNGKMLAKRTKGKELVRIAPSVP